ncbi:MAG: tetratricopeptide repeat protein [Candidatus Kariarchaeaceae archaeon]|jgi:tetratricopeptide (TPR) repeat protein
MGYYEKTRKRLEEIKSLQVPSKTRISVELLLARIKREYGKAKESLKISKHLVDESKKIGDTILLIRSLQETANAHWYLGNYNIGVQVCHDVADLLKNHPQEKVYRLLARNQLLLGNLFGDKGLPRDSLKYYTEAVTLYDKANDKYSAGLVFNNIGEVYRSQGKLDEALVCYEKSKEYFEEVDSRHNVSMGMSNIAEVLREKGNFTSALNMALEARDIFMSIDDIYTIPFTNMTIGLIYHSQGDLAKAIKFYQESVDVLSHQDNILWAAQSIFYYLLAYSEIDLDKCKEGLKLFQSLIDKNHEGIMLVELQYRAIQAVLLKKSNTLANLVKAQDIFSEIVNSQTIIDYSITLLSMKHLAELLLIELKLFNNEDTLRELIELITSLRNTAELHGSVLLQIQVYILFARLKAIDGQFDITNDTLEVAYTLAKESELPHLMSEIDNLRQEIIEEIKKYQDSGLDFKEIQNKLNQINVEAYLNEILIDGILSGKKQLEQE